MAVSKKLTRSEFECPLFGPPKDMPVNKLPTYEEVLRCCFFENYKIAFDSKKICKFFPNCSSCSSKVKALYDKASTPTVTTYRMIQLISSCHDSYRHLMKSFKRDKEKETFRQKLQNWRQRHWCFFDMSACKCKIPYSCNCQKVPEVCECPISISCLCEKEIPTLELKFVYFQRNLRKSLIGVIDVKETKKIDKSHLRKLTGRKRSNI